MSGLPASYASPLHLPFNATSLAGRLQLSPPDQPADGDPVWVLLRGGELLLDADGALPRGPAPPGGLPAGATPLAIGRWDGYPCRVLALSRQQEPPSGLLGENLSAAEPRLPIELLSLGGLAGQILHWQRDSRFCAACGTPTLPLPGNWGRRCGGCNREHFPHIHPCVIVVVRRPGELLLARKPGWPPGRYGLVAGFLDLGECLEEAVVREVCEETGIAVRDVRYVGSQNWPFPSQLMAGFTAEYAGGKIRVEEAELEDARWFPLDALPALPPKRSIARYLIDRHAATPKD